MEFLNLRCYTVRLINFGRFMSILFYVIRVYMLSDIVKRNEVLMFHIN